MATNLNNLNIEAKASLGIANEAMAVRATTITTIVDTIPASTAACPTISPPTTPMVFPSFSGSLIPASRRSSNKSSIIRTSTTIGKERLLRAFAMAYKSLSGSISLSKQVRAIYIPGRNMAINAAAYLMILANTATGHLL